MPETQTALAQSLSQPSATPDLFEINSHPGLALLRRVEGWSWHQLGAPALWPSWLDAAAIDDVRSVQGRLAALLSPARPDQIATWAGFLLTRYRPKVEALAAFGDMEKRVWIQTLRHWPLDVLEAAVLVWCGQDRPFPPAVPGELIPLGAPLLNERRALAAQAERLVAAWDREQAAQIPEELRADPELVRALVKKMGAVR